jgi:hypothetical protein
MVPGIQNEEAFIVRTTVLHDRDFVAERVIPELIGGESKQPVSAPTLRKTY